MGLLTGSGDSQDVRVAPEHPLDLWSLLQSVATKRTERKKAAAPSAVIILKKIDMDRIEIVNKYCGGGTLPKVINKRTLVGSLFQKKVVPLHP